MSDYTAHGAPCDATDDTSGEIILTQAEKDTLRALAQDVADIAALPVHAETKALWTALNDKNSVRPMVWINEIPWHEMNVDDELTLRCTHPQARELENQLRKTLYQWRHMPGDMVVEPYWECPLCIHSTEFGITEHVRVAQTDAQNDIVSREFTVQIEDFEDLEKIKLPKLTHCEEETQRRFSWMQTLFADILPVQKVGQKHIWYTPWDYLIRCWGVENAMIDLVERPELVHAAYERMVQAWMTQLDQLEQMNLLSLDCNNTRIGSGGYGYVSSLPGAPCSAPLAETLPLDHGSLEAISSAPPTPIAPPTAIFPHAPKTTSLGEHAVRAQNMWGCSNAQIFASVSPQMHWEFAVEHDLKWLSRFGLTYYGCCEPLDGKAEVLRRIPNLRKVSVSPWCHSARAVEQLGGDYVLSRKPNPAVFATTTYDPAEAERNLREFLDKAAGCHIELIMKDISTVKYDPRRLWDWEKLAMRLAREYAR